MMEQNDILMKQKSKVWERNTILKDRDIKLRGRKSNACKRNIILRERNIILRERESIAWEQNVFRWNKISLCIAKSPPGLRKNANSGWHFNIYEHEQ